MVIEEYKNLIRIQALQRNSFRQTIQEYLYSKNLLSVSVESEVKKKHPQINKKGRAKWTVTTSVNIALKTKACVMS